MFGRKIGPTGRKRDKFSVGAWNRNEENLAVKRHYRYKSATLEAYGQEGVKDAKKDVHRRNPRKWVKFSVYNDSRTHRMIQKRVAASHTKKRGK